MTLECAETQRLDVDLETKKSNVTKIKKQMDKNRIIEKLSWITQSKLAPQPITQEYKERQYRFF